ncbi:MAG: SGNH/GDSL hydrolase family protein [Solirubrobacteraceae bacterium]
MLLKPSNPGRASGLLVALILAAGCAGVLATNAAASVPVGTPFVVRAIGDSVTAGFGYCGLVDPHCTNGPGEPYSLSERSVCTGGDYDDRCSSNKGDYSAHLPGTLDVPAISWADQFALREDIPNFINYAVTGSTPSQWDTDTPHGFFNFHQLMNDVLNAHPNLTLLTMGANPVLKEFYSNPRDIACVALLTKAQVAKFAERELEKAGSMTHLEHVYERLLSDPNNHVIVMGYHTPHPALVQKVLGKLVEFYLPKFSRASEIIGVIDSTVAHAVAAVASKGNNHQRIHFVDMAPWHAEDHQCLDTAHDPWVISWDFCIHPTAKGYEQFLDRLVNYLRQNPAAAGFQPGWLS